MSREKMVPADNDGHLRLFFYMRGKLLDHSAQRPGRTKLVEFARCEKLGFVAGFEIAKISEFEISYRKSEAYQFRHARIVASSTQTHPGTEAETREEQ